MRKGKRNYRPVYRYMIASRIGTRSPWRLTGFHAYYKKREAVRDGCPIGGNYLDVVRVKVTLAEKGDQ